MNKEKPTSIVDNLIKISQVRELGEEFEGGYFSFGMGPSNVSFTKDAAKIYQSASRFLYSLNNDTYETVGFKNFEKELINLVRELRNSKKNCEKTDLNILHSKLLLMPLSESEVFYEIYGIELDDPQIQFGDFTIYNYDKAMPELIKKYPYLIRHRDYFSHRQSNHLISIKVTARDNDKTIELTDELCEKFQNVFSYAMSDIVRSHSVKIFDFLGWQHITKVICQKDSVGSSSSNNGLQLVSVTDPFFRKSEIGNDIVWSLITKPKKNEIERRLLNAIEWIGKAVDDKDPSKSIVQYVFALESMLQSKERDFISPSILSQIGDWLALIIADSVQDRKAILKHFKDIYSIRSAVAHGATKQISLDDLAIAMQLSKRLTMAFLVTKPYCDITSMEQLSTHFTDLKFK